MIYEIIVDGVPVAYTSHPHFIRLHENGCYVLCEKFESTGVAVDGGVYSLWGKEMPGVKAADLVEHEVGEEMQRRPTYDEMASAYGKGVNQA